MIELLASSDAHWSYVIFGRMHPMVVHFPIALLLVATFIEGLGLLRRRGAAGDAPWACVGLGALGAIASTIMGYVFANEYKATPDLELHERVGLITTIVACITALLCWRARRAGGTGGPAMAYRAFLFVSALGVSVTGHLGGDMVYGDIFRGTSLEKKEQKPLQAPAKAPEIPSVPIADKVDFEKQIAPIIKAACIKCHSATPPNKVKGKLRLETKEHAMKGGSGGKAIVAGKPENSPFYTLLLEADPEDRMPSDADPLPKEQIELIKKWIEQGAPWPDGFEIK